MKSCSGIGDISPARVMFDRDAPYRDVMVTYALESGEAKEYVTGYAAPLVGLKIYFGNELVASQITDENGYFKAYISGRDFIRAEQLSLHYTSNGGDHCFVTEAPDFEHPHIVTDLTVKNDWSGVSGHGVSGMVVEVRNKRGALVGSAAVDAHGYFDLIFNEQQISGQKLKVVEHSILDKHSDSFDLQAPDLTVPPPPVVDPMDDMGLHITGSGRAGHIITVFDEDGMTVLSTATIRDNGSYDATLSWARNHGEALHVKQMSDYGVDSMVVTVHARDCSVPDTSAADPLIAACSL